VVVKVVKVERSGKEDALAAVVVIGRVCASISLGVVAFSSSTVSGSAVFAALIVVAGGLISV
jgi:hypothetical protein